MLLLVSIGLELFPQIRISQNESKYSKKDGLNPFMQRVLYPLITIFIVTLLWGCSSIEEKEWTQLIPEGVAFVIIPEEGVKATDLPNTDYANLLDDITQTSLLQIATFDPQLLAQIDLKALALYPSTSTSSRLIWITESSLPIESWVTQYYEPLAQNYYTFNGITIHKITAASTTFFVSQTHNWLIFSDSSVALEFALRSYVGTAPALELQTAPVPGQLIMNTSKLDRWVEQFSLVSNRPAIYQSLNGTKPASLEFSKISDAETESFNIEGNIKLEQTRRSALIDALSSENRPLVLDRYIASNAAAFGVMRLAPKLLPIRPETRVTKLDSLLLDSPGEFGALAATMDSPFAFVAFAESGLLSSGEYLFMRRLLKQGEFRAKLYELSTQGYLTQQGNSYYASSSVLAKLIGSELCTFSDFYISFSGDVVVISKRRGLSEGVESDRTRRRVVYYNNDYGNIRRSLPDEISGFVWANTSDFEKFIGPYLLPRNSSSSLLNISDIAYITLQKQNDNSLDFTLNTANKEGSILPYQELWVTPLTGGQLTGEPILGDIIGSKTEEIIFATDRGEVIAVASDGTVVMEASTDGNIPIGSPILYDWYGNNQPIIMLAAGSKVFGWNRNGTPLPKFPIELGEPITAPIVITDVLRNGIPEIIAATEDRKIHVIDGRGANVIGWPQTVNAVVTSKPLYARIDGTWSIWTFSQNILHSWLRSGATRPGYPQFINAGFNGEPVVYGNSIMGAGIDGYIYAVGKNPSLIDSLSTSVRMDSISIKSLYVTNSELLSVGVEENVLLRDSTRFYREDLITTQSRNGSVFLYNPRGELRITHSLGQPASNTLHPRLEDINSDGTQEIITLADFGRLFSWEVLTDERIYDLPTSGMRYPIIVDFNGDGQKELVAQTREGLRCWTINKMEDN